MAELPVRQHTTATAIFESYERRQRESKPRPHLGASIIGKSCSRAIWYDHRWAARNQFDGRMLRLFDTGNSQEFRIKADLKNAGVRVDDNNPRTGKQWDFNDHGGHMSGSMDAALLNLVEAPEKWHVGEMKTHNAKSFANLVKKGVAESKPQHLHQMNTYCGWSGMADWMYLAVNKDNDDLYVERGKFDKAMFEADRAKGLMVITSPRPLAKITDDPKWFECSFCDHNNTCHVGQAPAVSCRTCIHATAVVTEGSSAGVWTCDRYKCELTTDQQIAGCESHLTIPDLLPYGEPLASGPDGAPAEWILYKNSKNGQHFANCTNVGMPPIDLVPPETILSIYTSVELSGLHPNLVGDEQVDYLKKEFGGKVIPIKPAPITIQTGEHHAEAA